MEKSYSLRRFTNMLLRKNMPIDYVLGNGGNMKDETFLLVVLLILSLALMIWIKQKFHDLEKELTIIKTIVSVKE